MTCPLIAPDLTFSTRHMPLYIPYPHISLPPPPLPLYSVGHLQIDGEIILWSSLWENLSRLMANESTVDSLIDGKGLGTGPRSAVTPSSSSSASVMMDLTGDGDSSFSSSSSGSGSGAYGTNFGIAQDQGLAAVQGRPRSDSDYARELQAQWAAEDGQGPGLGQGLGEVNQWGAYNSSNTNDITSIVPNLIPTGTGTDHCHC